MRFTKIDITEITGFDDLHHPEEMIRELMDDLKQIYGTKESYLLVNSSTAGNLAAIAALCNIGDKILVARNCHKSVYHAIELLDLIQSIFIQRLMNMESVKALRRNR